MINTQLALIRRELWEHRAIYVVPAVLGLVLVLTSITGQVAVSNFGQELDIAILGASNLGDAERSAAISAFLLGVTTTFVMTMGILTIFYALDALYAERKDKSILFWRSLPVTDAETVVSKLLTALLVIPLITIAVMAVTHLVMLLVTTIWLETRGADAWSMLWSAAPLIDTWVASFILFIALAIWVSPFAGWFLFVSAFTKRSPFLMAFLPLILVPMLESILLRSSVFAGMLLDRVPFKAPIIRDLDQESFNFEEQDLIELAREGLSLLSIVDVGRFLTSPSVWIGIVVCALFCTAAIYVRRYRDDS